uniref:Putative salivary kunitz domain protein n=1 Tax=Ixodes ricinus TaxID=34613 RepID=A0A0K8R7X3_IXORI
MKAILAVTCFLSAVVLICALSKEECLAPYAGASCSTDARVGVFYYYHSGNGRCESEFSCQGPRNFPSEEQCRNECPYGTYASRG